MMSAKSYRFWNRIKNGMKQIEVVAAIIRKGDMLSMKAEV